MDNILQTIKKLLGGYDGENTYFDTDLIIFINSAFVTLAQLGVGPVQPFVIDENTLWEEFECYDLEAVKEYIYLKVKTVFDPPLNSSILGAYQSRMSELEWRLNVFVEDLKDEKCSNQLDNE